MTQQIEPTTELPSSATSGWPDTIRSFAEGQNDFAFGLYKELHQQPGNLFFSPFSIRTALGMTFVGARGETANQMCRALRLASSEESLDLAFAEIIQQLTPADGGKYEFTIGNSLWSQDGIPLLPEFSELIGRYYRGEVNLVDFRINTEVARTAINRWVEEKTRQKIKELIPWDGISPDTRLVLANAIYFKGIWMSPFRTYDLFDPLNEEPFYLEDGSEVRTPLMFMQKEVRYVKGEDFQAVELNYQGDNISMLVFLPNRKDGLLDLEKRLQADMLEECVKRMQVREIKIFLPKFKLTWGTINLKNQLSAIGMPIAFNRDEADFSGINGLQPPDDEALHIGAVCHKAFVEVNEKGTEAAAATGVSMDMFAGLPPKVPVFRADHPFLFGIRDQKSGSILFLGRLANPTQGS